MTPAIEVRGLGKRRGARWVVDEVSFAIAPGEIVALIGGNGAGKSTTLAMIAGALAVDRGWVAIAGATSGARRRVGYVPEGADPPGHLTAAELWALVGGLRGGATLAPEVHAALALDAVADRPFAKMSLGQRRRACLAAALIGAPPALILDEPDNGLDATALTAMAALLTAAAAAGAGVVIATHDPAVHTGLAARTLTLVDGRLAT
ncbi:MAG: ATP-binding cassette domain-containing protein [Myxococcales bacterium]|nr:ATP-binding cassette domain-containing protein [Myxococcales bacterium]